MPLDTLLQTKLYIPPVRPELVSRPRLIEQLDEGLRLGRRLTLVSAPAGFGKTTLVSEWIANVGARPVGALRDPATDAGVPAPLREAPPQVACLSLDERDSDPARFLTYLIAALQTIEAGLGEGAMSRLQSPQPPAVESVLTSLVNDVAAHPGRLVLVLDDYHAIDANAVDHALTFLLEHLPPAPGGLHLVIVTREDPNLPLARLRAQGQLTELRISDLRFTSSEAAEFFNQVMELDLSADDVTSLETRTEGWIAGLQLAALSMRGREDVSGFIRAFAGDNRYVVDYLVEEVLQRQPAAIREFLLETSILERMTGQLCDAIVDGGPRTDDTGGTTLAHGPLWEGQAVLEYLDKHNLFVVPLDDKRQWYRYHHLFSGVLRARLMEELPILHPTLHLRASEWYEQNGLPADAIRHSLAAEDFERAAGLVELAWPAMNRSFQSATWLGWVRALPDDLVRARPVLSVGYGWALLNSGELEAADARLRDAERWLEPTSDPNGRPGAPSVEMVVIDEEQFRSLPASIASARTYHAQALGDVASSVKHARRALDLLPAGDLFGRGRAGVLLGLAYWASGDLEDAHRSFAGAMASFQQAGNLLFAISFTFILADIRVAQGRLHEAVSTYERSLQLAAERGEPVLQGTADLLLGLSELQREQGDLEAARQHLLRSEELGDQTEVYQYRLCVARARIKEDQGDLDGALAQLQEAERLYFRSPLPDVRPVAALKARVWLAQGRLTEAQGWVRERGLSVDDQVSYLREFEHVTLARVLIARYQIDRLDGSLHQAVGLLERLLEAAEEGGRTGSVIEILIQLALAHQAHGDIPRALGPLERALTLAEPEGYVRIFVDEGPPMAALLTRILEAQRKGQEAAAAHGTKRKYMGRLQAALGKAEESTPATQPLIEPLSKRELQVLRLLGTELNGPEIARELVVSLNTMRTHTKNIYGKLGVNSRRAAVRCAEELELL
ncbi:tetratricopeptide repeat protein [Chloroflexota bacterium]